MPLSFNEDLFGGTPDPPVIHQASAVCTDQHCIALAVNAEVTLYGRHYADSVSIPRAVRHFWDRYRNAWTSSSHRLACNSAPPPTECECWNCEHAARLENGDYCDCEECVPYEPDASEANGIESYSYKPHPNFFGAGPTYLGVELELEYDYSGYGSGFQDAVDSAIDAVGSRAYLKEDGSIDYGFELVTHPHDLDAHQKGMDWQKVMRTLSQSGMKAASTCGMHVHVSRAGFSTPRHAYLWQQLIYRNQATVTKVARRNSTEWAAWPTAYQRRTEIPIVAKHLRDPYAARQLISPDRYRAINIYPDSTFEMRVFASTTNHEELLAGVELVAASVEYTRGLRSNDVLKRHALTSRAFTDYVKGHESYSNLAHAV